MNTKNIIKDIPRINTELSKTENTKYSTVNGIKEFECNGDGYVDNIYIEGCTKILDDNNQECLPGTTGVKLVSVGQSDKIEVLARREYGNINNSILDYKTFAAGVDSGYDSKKLHATTVEYIYIEYQKIYVNFKISNTLNNIAIYMYDINKKYIGLIIASDCQNNTQLYELDSNCKYVKIRAHSGASGDGLPIDLSKTELYVGYTKDIVYPPKYDKKQILITCRSVNDTIKDIVYKQGDKYYKVKRCEEIILNNNMEYSLHSSNSNTLLFTTIIPNIKSTSGENGNVINTKCDKFNSTTRNTNFNSDIEGVSNAYLSSTDATKNGLCIRIAKTKLTTTQDVSGFKTWISQNPVTVVYELATPIIEELPNFNPRTFDNKTTILLDSGVVQGEASFDVTNSLRSELEVLKNNFPSIDNEFLILKNKIIDINTNAFFTYNIELKSDIDLNNLFTSGYYKIQNCSTNMPTNSYKYGVLLVFNPDKGSECRTVQIYIPDRTFSTDGIYYRSSNNKVWKSWQKTATSTTLSLLEQQISELEIQAMESEV